MFSFLLAIKILQNRKEIDPGVFQVRMIHSLLSSTVQVALSAAMLPCF